MAPNLTARDLMKLSFLRLGAGHSLREALAILLDPEARGEGPRVLIVLNADGTFAGTLTTRFLLRALLPDWVEQESAGKESADFEQRLLDAMQEKLEIRVADAMNREVPTVSLDDRLPLLIEMMQNQRLDCVPVLDDDRVVGVVYLSDVFNAAARLALAAQSEDHTASKK